MAKNYFKAQVSAFINNMHRTPQLTITIEDWIALCTDDCSVISKLRKENNEALRKILKASLPAATISGVFTPTRKADNCVKHSGLICVDIDGKDNVHITNWEQCKREIGEMAEVLYCGLSVSGNGMFAIIPIAESTLHKEHFTALKDTFASYGLSVDEHCSDIARLRYLTYDPEPIVNMDAVAFEGMATTELNGSKTAALNGTEANTLREILNDILSRGLDITAAYDHWFKIGMALANTFGENGRQPYHDISQFNPKYNKAECNKKYTGYLRDNKGQIKFGTLIHIYKLYAGES